MCGHVGIAGNLTHRDEALMKRLLIFDYFRGPDSTGLASIRQNGDAQIAKIASHPVDLFDTSRFKSALAATSSKVFLGHNRLATRGVVNGVNAHPYHFDHIIGAHNGTLESKDKWALEDAIGEKFDVDSQALFAAIAKLGVDAVIPMLTSCDTASNSSAWALVWYDQNEGSINFLRNQHRPLWYGFTKDFKQILWGSQWEIIDNANRVGSPAHELYVEEGTNFKYWPFDEDVHYKFDVGVLKGATERVKPKAKVLKGKEPAKPTGATGGNPFGRQNVGFHATHINTSTGNTSTTTSRGKNSNKESKSIDVIHWLGDVGSPFAGYIEEERFDDMAKHGCSWCQAKLTFGEPGYTIYDRDDMILCPVCSGYDPENANAATKIYVPDHRLKQLL